MKNFNFLQKTKAALGSTILLLAVLMTALSLVPASCSKDDELEIPSAPDEAPVLTVGNAGIEVEWSPVDGATSYEVWINTANSTNTAARALSDVRENTCVVDNLENGTTYYVWVKSKNKTGTSGFSPSASGTPGDGSADDKMYYEGTIVITTKGVYGTGESIDAQATITGVKYEEFMYLPEIGLRLDCTGGFAEAYVNIISEGATITYEGSFRLEQLSLGFGLLTLNKNKGTYQLLIMGLSVPAILTTEDIGTFETGYLFFFNPEALAELPLPDNTDRPLVLRGEKTEIEDGVPTTITWDLTRHFYQ